MEYYELYHHGIKGQKWGIRRFQNPDGTLTSAGKKHKSSMSSEQKKKVAKAIIGGTLAAASVTALAVYAKKNPEKILQAELLAKGMTIKAKDLSKKGIDKGKNYLADAKSKKIAKKDKIKSIKEDLKNIDSLPLSEVQERLKDANARAQLKKMVGAQLDDSKGKKIAKAMGTAAATTGTALTLYGNLDRMKKIVNDNKKKKKKTTS